MSVDPVPPHRLWTLDIAASDFAKGCVEGWVGGSAIASADTEGLWALAHRIAADLTAWTAAHEALDAARAGAFPPDRCGRRLVEALFDDALTPSAARVLAAALDVAIASVTVPRARDG